MQGRDVNKLSFRCKVKDFLKLLYPDHASSSRPSRSRFMRARHHHPCRRQWRRGFASRPGQRLAEQISLREALRLARPRADVPCLSEGGDRRGGHRPGPPGHDRCRMVPRHGDKLSRLERGSCRSDGGSHILSSPRYRGSMGGGTVCHGADWRVPLLALIFIG